ncbi:MAG: four helix bundle protein [Candidatus Omnitrophota bacterium]
MNGEKIRNFKDLLIWKEGVNLVEKIYQVTKSFPKEELYGITAQIRRAAISIPSNISEGFMRKHNKEFKQFLFIALGSNAEVETQLIISNRLGYLKSEQLSQLEEVIDKINKMTMSLIKKL